MLSSTAGQRCSRFLQTAAIAASKTTSSQCGVVTARRHVVGDVVRRSYTSHSQLPEEHRMVYEMCRKFAEEELKPNAGTWDKKHEFPQQAVSHLVGCSYESHTSRGHNSAACFTTLQARKRLTPSSHHIIFSLY
jgi:hypothetical protein